MTFIKICGLVRREDALLAAALGADAAGFVFVEGSPRFCADPSAARDLPIRTVGVFADAPEGEVNRIAEEARLDLVQLHGSESPEYCARIERPVIKAFRGPIDAADRYRAFAVLADGPRSGETFDWAALPRVASRLIVAGGLGPENVARAMREARPFGVDVSSGIERAPGVKDGAAMRRFIEAVRTHQQEAT